MFDFRSSVGLLLGLEHGNYLQQSLSSGNILHEAQNPISHRVHFNLPSVGNKMDPSVLSTSPGKSTHKANDGKVKAVHESRQVRFQSTFTFRIENLTVGSPVAEIIYVLITGR